MRHGILGPAVDYMADATHSRKYSCENGTGGEIELPPNVKQQSKEAPQETTHAPSGPSRGHIENGADGPLLQMLTERHSGNVGEISNRDTGELGNIQPPPTVKHHTKRALQGIPPYALTAPLTGVYQARR